MSADDYADLARHAEAIPPEHRTWDAADEHGNVPDGVPAWCVSPVDEHGKWLGDVVYIPQGLDNEEVLARFIAAANPATILRLIETLRQERVCYTDECGEPCRSHVALLWAERDTARKKAGLIGQRLGKVRAERDELAARLAAVEALTDTLDADLAAADPAHFSIGLMRGRLKTLRAVLSAAPTDTTKETP